MGQLKFDGVEFPVKADAKVLQRIEMLNGIALNVYALSDEDCSAAAFKSKIYAVYITEHKTDAINLFFYKGHWLWIHSWQRFTNKSGEHYHHCPRCMHSCASVQNLQKHVEDCTRHDPMNTSMPAEGSAVMFKKWNRTIRHPVNIIADTEAFNQQASARG